jgi:hypothetical protein
MEKAQVLKNIGSIGRASAKLTKDIQATAVGCVEHAVKHGDVTLADQLVDALGKGLRKASLRAWFEKNAPMFIAKGKVNGIRIVKIHYWLRLGKKPNPKKRLSQSSMYPSHSTSS